MPREALKLKATLHRYEHHLMQATGAFRDGPYREKLTAALEDADAAIAEKRPFPGQSSRGGNAPELFI